MPNLIVKMKDGDRSFTFSQGQSLRDFLDTTDLRIRAGCRGNGSCGFCRVKIEKGDTSEPTVNERIYLDESELENGIRLACQTIPQQDIEIEILEWAPESNWRSLPINDNRIGSNYPISPPENIYDKIKAPIGVAVDLGTTHINLSMCDLKTGKRLAGRYGLNPQTNDGLDVVNRLNAASESKEKALELSRQIINAIGEALFDMATRECIDIQQVMSLAIVGNTPMLALLTGHNYKKLNQPDYWMSEIDCFSDNTSKWAASWGIDPRAKIEIVQPMAGFVGSDLLAGVLTTRLTEKPGSLFIDFGTNSEMALWDGKDLWTTSAAGGPAFEGCGMSCGMPAVPGAIHRVQFNNGVPELGVINNSEILGLCGTGLVDLISGLTGIGKLSKEGRFTSDVSKEGFNITRQKKKVVLTKADVDIFQRAKAAIGAGVKIMLERSEITGKDIQHLYVGGAFGYFLNIENSINIGLLPDINPELIELCGNTALAGCENILLSSEASAELTSLKEKGKIINMAQCDDFEDFFFENLFLEPMRVDFKNE